MARTSYQKQKIDFELLEDRRREEIMMGLNLA
jgi:hypothetical protein